MIFCIYIKSSIMYCLEKKKQKKNQTLEKSLFISSFFSFFNMLTEL